MTLRVSGIEFQHKCENSPRVWVVGLVMKFLRAIRNLLFSQGGLKVGYFENERRLRLPWIVGALSRVVDRKVLRVQWLVKPRSESCLGFANRGDLIEMALGQVSLGSETLRASRIVKRENPMTFGLGVYWKYELAGMVTSGLISGAEDPRIFEYREQLWIYYQVWDFIDGDTSLYIFAPKSGQTYRLKSPNRVQGKNWTPLVFKNDLYFVTSFEPFVLMKADLYRESADSAILLESVEFALTNPEAWANRSRDVSGIGAVRGGTRLVEIAPGVMGGFTHINVGGRFEKSHQIGYVELDMNARTLKHCEITKQKLNLLAAPYGLELEGNDEIAVTFNCSVGSVHNEYQPVVNRRAVFGVGELKEFVKSVNAK